MSEFLGMRRIWIDLADSVTLLPKELGCFRLYPTETDGVYDVPYISLNSKEWSEFERTLFSLKVKGRCNGWKVVTVH